MDMVGLQQKSKEHNKSDNKSILADMIYSRFMNLKLNKADD